MHYADLHAAVSWKVPFLVVVGAAVVILVLLVCIGVVCYKHRKMSSRYSLLVSESSKQYEMETLDNATAQQA